MRHYGHMTFSTFFLWPRKVQCTGSFRHFNLHILSRSSNLQYAVHQFICCSGRIRSLSNKTVLGPYEWVFSLGKWWDRRNIKSGVVCCSSHPQLLQTHLTIFWPYSTCCSLVCLPFFSLCFGLWSDPSTEFLMPCKAASRTKKQPAAKVLLVTWRTSFFSNYHLCSKIFSPKNV